MPVMSKMLTYTSLQSVLQYMEANLRFELSQQLPLIRTAEKTAPLQIVNFYSDGESVLRINNIAYNLILVREYTKFDNAAKTTTTFPFDVDVYGNKDWDCLSMETPGDVPIFKDRFRAEAEYDQRARKRNKILPSDEFSIKLSVDSPKGLRTERIAYSKKLYEAHKYRITKLLGRGHSVVRVKDVYISMPGGVLRWPLGLKLVVQNLKLLKIEEMEHDQKILCDTSYPLKQLETFDFPEELPETTKKVIEESDRLVMSFVPNYEFIRHRIRNRRFRTFCSALNAFDYMNIVRDWRAEKRMIGSCLEFDVWDGPEIGTFFELLKYPAGMIPVGDKTIHIPIDENTTIEVEYNAKQLQLSIKVVSNDTLQPDKPLCIQLYREIYRKTLQTE